MKELDTNLYMFQFYHELDVKCVMEGCPWSFNRRALVMARLKEGDNPRSVVLNSMELWVQVHDLKVGFMTAKILQGIRNYIGQFIASCPNNFVGVWREYMRIRFSINLNSPLKRRMKIKMAGDSWFWVNFKYENVPTFCFICGIIGHSEKFCSKLFDVPEAEITKPYGSWMRAPFRNQFKPIGAKWLRTGKETDGCSTESETHSNHGDNNLVVSDPKITPENVHAGRIGENVGISISTILNSKAGNEKGNIIPGDKENIIVIESKKRRTGDGLVLDTNVGLNKDVLMGYENETMQDMDSESAEASDNNVSSKNVYGTSTQEKGARLPS